jgi:hypothetical protein
MDNKNSKIREMLVNGITEDDFIEKFDELIEFIGFKFFDPAEPKIGKLAGLKRMWMPSCLEKIYTMNPTKNNWANYERISEKLKLFLKLKGEEV